MKILGFWGEFRWGFKRLMKMESATGRVNKGIWGWDGREGVV